MIDTYHNIKSNVYRHIISRLFINLHVMTKDVEIVSFAAFTSVWECFHRKQAQLIKKIWIIKQCWETMGSVLICTSIRNSNQIMTKILFILNKTYSTF